MDDPLRSPDLMGQASPKKKRPGRRHTVPPPPSAVGWARELGALKPLGAEMRMVLWRALRRVRLWADVPEDGREGLFLPPSDAVLQATGRACVQAPVLIEPLGVFTSLLRDPHHAEGARLGEACRQVFEWADAQGMLPVAVQFAEAGAAADPRSPARANDAARLCRRAAYDDRAGEWYLRAFKLAVRAKGRKNRKEALRALRGYGALMKDSGRIEEAKFYYNRAARRAHSMGLRRDAGSAHHDLMGLAAETGAVATAEWHARLALRFYPIHYPRVPALAHDFAFLLVLQYYFSPALALLVETIPLIQHPGEQIVVWSTLAWAAAGAGRWDRFHEAESVTLHGIEHHDEFAPVALIHLAEGCRALLEWDKAAQYAAAAAESARKYKDTDLESEALALREKIAIQTASPGETPASKEVEALARRISARLRQWQAPSRRRPGADAASDESCGQRTLATGT